MDRKKSQSLIKSELESDLHIAKAAAIQTAKAMHTPVTCMSEGRTPKHVLHDLVSQFNTVDEPSILAVDLAAIARQFFLFRSHLPNVTLHYAVKCFPDPMVITMLANMGASFDCASGEELKLVDTALHTTSSLLSSSSSPSSSSSSSKSNEKDDMGNRAILANAIKSISDLRIASELNVHRVTLDCVEEVRKIALHMPHASALLRIATDDTSSMLPLSDKFGARSNEIVQIFDEARRVGLNLVGVAFHVGSGAQSIQPYDTAFKLARTIFETARRFGFNMTVLDIGGGFPGTDKEANITFLDIAQCIRRNIDTLFHDIVHELSILAEPGRFIACSCASLATRVEQKLQLVNGRTAYCLADGIYGLFRDAWMFGYRYVPTVLFKTKSASVKAKLNVDVNGDDDDDHHHRNRRHTGEEYEEEEEEKEEQSFVEDGDETCDLLGSTMEIGDVITKDVKLPQLHKGDWVVFDNMGSYTSCLRTARTDVPRASVIYIFCESTLLLG